MKPWIPTLRFYQAEAKMSKDGQSGHSQKC